MRFFFGGLPHKLTHKEKPGVVLIKYGVLSRAFSNEMVVLDLAFLKAPDTVPSLQF